MEITKGQIKGAQKVVVYGPEGIGKSTFVSMFPDPLFIDTEGSTKHMDVARLPRPGSWTMLLEEVKHVKDHPGLCKTLIIDTADWAEKLCIEHICAKAQVTGLESFGYGKGYTYLEEEFGRLLNRLEDIIDLGINVTLTAHAQMRKFEQPDEMGAYDRWELKLQKKTAPLLKEWADMVLFANYETLVVNIDGQGAQKGKNKARGGKRVMHTTHHPCWDAKNREGLPEKLDFEYDKISHCIPSSPVNPAVEATKKEESAVATAVKNEEQTAMPGVAPPADPAGNKIVLPRALAELMAKDEIYPEEIQWVVAVKGNGGKGYYPIDTPIDNYDSEFVNGALVGMWPQIVQMVQEKRTNEKKSNDEWEKLKNGEPNSIEKKVS
jgi:GTPase SAR1 family protein